MDGMMDCGSMMWGMGFVWLLVILLLVLGIAALVKYLFFSNRRDGKSHDHGSTPGGGDRSQQRDTAAVHGCDRGSSAGSRTPEAT